MAVEGSVPEIGAIVPHLIARDVASAVAFYKRAFGAEVLFRAPLPSGAGEHVHLRIYTSLVQLSTEDPPRREQIEGEIALSSPERLGGSTCVFQLRVSNLEIAYERAIESGAKPMLPPTTMFWGDRYSLVCDPLGHCWAIIHVDEILPPESVIERSRAFALSPRAHE